MVTGKYVNTGGSTGGDINVGLKNTLGIFLQPWGAAILANQPVVNEVFPNQVANGAQTVVNTANESGSYVAFGFGS